LIQVQITIERHEAGTSPDGTAGTKIEATVFPMTPVHPAEADLLRRLVPRINAVLEQASQEVAAASGATVVDLQRRRN
jgi:hypothetical protein